jgi:hypothetical protein
MEFEEIGRVWREEGTGTIRRTRIEDLTSVLGRAKRLGVARRRRFARLAWIAAVPMVLFFSYMAWAAPNYVAASGAVLMAVVAAFIAVRYRAIGRRESDAALPVRLALQAELTHQDALARLQRDAPRVRTLYWLGFGVYVVGIVFPGTGNPEDRALALGFFLSVLLVVEGLIYFSHRRGPRAGGTLKDELRSWLDSLDELDASQAGDSDVSTNRNGGAV